MTAFKVEIDTAGVVATAVRRLAERGCRRLGLLSWRSVEPFRQAVSECGLVTADAWIRSERDPAVRGAGWDEFREIWAAAGDKPDGLVFLDDMLFFDAQLAMMEMRVRVPQDLQLVVQTSRGAAPPIRLSITAIEIDLAEAAAAFADLIGKRLRGEPLAPSTRLLSFREVPPQPDIAMDASPIRNGEWVTK